MDPVDFDKKSLFVAMGSIAFYPIFWNILARQEYHKKTLTKLFAGNSRCGSCLLDAAVFGIGLFRDSLCYSALRQQPSLDVLDTDAVKLGALAMFFCGRLLFLMSIWSLGFTGTYNLADYLGIAIANRAGSFPYRLTEAPMYYGSPMAFLGSALWCAKPAGLLLMVEIFTVYKIALKFEDPFTCALHAKRQ
ncbi:phospholipid methyltransferase-domain-containing protein [Tuber brumale]|nr:phospholipid methyltransferase-domain-containing protein [Tuber brumale]